MTLVYLLVSMNDIRNVNETHIQLANKLDANCSVLETLFGYRPLNNSIQFTHKLT